MGASVNMASKPTSFYFFDFDRNIMRVSVPRVLINMADGREMQIPAEDYMEIRDKIGNVAPWKQWSDKEALRFYRDLPDVPPLQQPFVEQTSHLDE